MWPFWWVLVQAIIVKVCSKLPRSIKAIRLSERTIGQKRLHDRQPRLYYLPADEVRQLNLRAVACNVCKLPPKNISDFFFLAEPMKQLRL